MYSWISSFISPSEAQLIPPPALKRGRRAQWLSRRYKAALTATAARSVQRKVAADLHGWRNHVEPWKNPWDFCWLMVLEKGKHPVGGLTHLELVKF